MIGPAGGTVWLGTASEVESYTWLCMDLFADLETLERELEKVEAKEKRAIVIKCGGREHVFTFRQFFDRLGIDHGLPDKPIIV